MTYFDDKRYCVRCKRTFGEYLTCESGYCKLSPEEPLRALSVQQPWAWLEIKRYKTIENRTWSTNRRGDFLIHAGKKFDREGFAWVKKTFPLVLMPEIDDFDRGGIVGMATLSDVVTRFNTKWFFGPYGFVLKHAKPLPFVPMKGKLGFFTPDKEIKL